MSVTIQLPDNTRREYDGPVTAAHVAADISPRLADAALAAEIDGRLTDLSTTVTDGTHTLRLLTDRNPEALEVVRHTAAHVLAQAVTRLYGPGVQYTIGPALMGDFQYGFYYDFDLPQSISAEDLAKIEAEMRRIIGEKLPVERTVLSPADAKARFAELHQGYKVELIEDLVRDEKADTVSLYRQGDFVDLCRGPHLPDTGRLKAFKLVTTAGAYWRGDETRKMLTRIYGTAFFSNKELEEHLVRIEEARKRDHRVLGRQLDLFTFSDDVGPGLPLWKPKGAILRMELEGWLREELRKRNYQFVITPHIGKLDLWRTSGHYPYYEHGLFPTMLPAASTEGKELLDGLTDLVGRAGEDSTEELPDERDRVRRLGVEGRYPFGAAAWERLAKARYLTRARTEAGREEGLLLKPMNCPFHIQIYKSQQHSYRDLPMRLSEFGTVYRFEQSGELSGLTRVRGFTQDDAHIFCTPEQLEDEIESCVELAKMVLETLGMTDYRVRIGLRDPDSSKYVGDDALWDRAEDNIRHVVSRVGLPSSEERGEAAFYGPKIDFVVKDCLGREWQLGTVQVDYNLPQRFGLEYIGADNAPHRPVMIHRAPLGSPERFIGILIEHFAGAFPLWLSPSQVAVLPVSEKFDAYAGRVHEALAAAGIRSEWDQSPEKIGAKIRRATLQKVPYMVIVGQREAESGAVSVRRLNEGDLGAMPLDRFLSELQDEIATKGGHRLQAAAAE